MVKKHHTDIDVVIRWAGLPSPTKRTKCQTLGFNPDAVLPSYSPDLKFCLRSLKHVPWAHRVFLLVDDDELLPPWLCTDKLTVVRHSQFIPAPYLPTYNSNTIDSFVHRVPRLAEHFIVLDDECFILKPTPPAAFFTPAPHRLPITRHYEGRDRHLLRTPSKIVFVRMWQNAIRTYHLKYTRVQHQAQPFLKSVLQAYEQTLFAPALVQQAAPSHRIRTPTDVNVLRFASALMSTRGQNRMVKTSPAYDLFLEGPHLSADQANTTFDRATRPTFLCINNTHPDQTAVYRLLRRLFPKKSPYEQK